MRKPRRTLFSRRLDRRLAAIEAALRELAELFLRVLSRSDGGRLDVNTLRDIFATTAMHRLLERLNDDGRYSTVETIARLAYDQAMAMLTERDQSSPV